MKKRLWALLAAFYIVVCSHTLFEATIGDDQCYDEGVSILPFDSSSFLVSSAYNCAGNPTGWKSRLLMLNNSGDTIKVLPDVPFNGIMKKNSDGTLVFAGGNRAGFVYDTAFVFKTSADGDLLWKKSLFPEKCKHTISDIFPVENGYVVCGIFATGNCAHPVFDAYVVKLDENGDKLWEYIFAEPGNDQLHSVKASENFIAAFGWSDSRSFTHTEYLLIKLDHNGNHLFTKVFGEPQSDFGYGMDLTPDNGFILTGYSDQMSAIRLNESGEVMWAKKLMQSCGGRYFQVTRVNDEFAFLGIHRNVSNNCVSVMVMTDDEGNELWRKTFSGILRNMYVEKPNRFLFAGYAGYPSQIYVVAFDTTFPVIDTTEVPPIPVTVAAKNPNANTTLYTYPNPVLDKIIFETESADLTDFSLKIFNAEGKLVLRKLALTTEKNVIDIDFLKTGIYTYVLSGNEKLFSGKFLKM